MEWDSFAGSTVTTLTLGRECVREGVKEWSVKEERVGSGERDDRGMKE